MHRISLRNVGYTLDEYPPKHFMVTDKYVRMEETHEKGTKERKAIFVYGGEARVISNIAERKFKELKNKAIPLN